MPMQPKYIKLRDRFIYDDKTWGPAYDRSGRGKFLFSN